MLSESTLESPGLGHGKHSVIVTERDYCKMWELARNAKTGPRDVLSNGPG